MKTRIKGNPDMPAMAAGIETRLWSMEDIAALIDPFAPDKRGPYKKN